MKNIQQRFWQSWIVLLILPEWDMWKRIHDWVHSLYPFSLFSLRALKEVEGLKRVKGVKRTQGWKRIEGIKTVCDCKGKVRPGQLYFLGDLCTNLFNYVPEMGTVRVFQNLNRTEPCPFLLCTLSFDDRSRRYQYLFQIMPAHPQLMNIVTILRFKI
jgi:hypothetical protein